VRSCGYKDVYAENVYMYNDAYNGKVKNVEKQNTINELRCIIFLVRVEE
jgi:hypothetical protein